MKLLSKLKFDKEKKAWFMPILKKDIKLIYINMGLGQLSSILGLSMAIFSQKLIDEILPSKDFTYMFYALLVLIGFLGIKMFIGFHSQVIGMEHSKRFNFLLIERFFGKLLSLPKSFFDKENTGSMIARMNDSGSIHGTVTYIANTLILNILGLITAGAMLFSYSKIMGLITILSFPCFFLLAWWYKDIIRAGTKEVMEANGVKESNYIVTVQNTDLLRANNKRRLFTRLNLNSYLDLQNSAYNLGKKGIKFGMIVEGTGTVFYLVLLAYASFLTVNEEITIGTFAAVLGIAGGMLPSIAVLGLSVMHLQGARVAFDRLFEYMSQNPELRKDDDQKLTFEQITDIEFQGVKFRYEKSEFDVLEDISFKVGQNQIVTFFGENGSGKSTIIKLIMAFYKVKEGSIYINDTPMEDCSVEGYRGRIGYVSQATSLFNKSLIENICLEPDPKIHEQAKYVLSAWGFDKYISKISHGYDTQIYENGVNLSGGQKQMIAFARAIINDPDILILDEFTASMDNDAEEFLLNLLKKYKNRGSVIMVTHKTKAARISDFIHVLDKGRISASGSHEELVLYDNIYSNSFEKLTA